MVSHIELGTKMNNLPQECEASQLTSNYNRLSTITLKGGRTLILGDNREIMVPMAARENIKKISHETHLRHDMMFRQLRGKVFWAAMNSELKEMVAKCNPCQRYHRSHAKEKTEVSHMNMFDIWAGHTIHMDFTQYKNNRLHTS